MKTCLSITELPSEREGLDSKKNRKISIKKA